MPPQRRPPPFGRSFPQLDGAILVAARHELAVATERNTQCSRGLFRHDGQPPATSSIAHNHRTFPAATDDELAILVKRDAEHQSLIRIGREQRAIGHAPQAHIPRGGPGCQVATVVAEGHRCRKIERTSEHHLKNGGSGQTGVLRLDLLQVRLPDCQS